MYSCKLKANDHYRLLRLLPNVGKFDNVSRIRFELESKILMEVWENSKENRRQESEEEDDFDSEDEDNNSGYESTEKEIVFKKECKVSK